MVKRTSEHVVEASGRQIAHVIHYDLSYILQGAEHGTDGAIVLLHDIPAGAFTWTNILPQLASLDRAVYAIDMLGYGLSEFPWPSDTSIWGHADYLSMFLDEHNLRNVILVGHGLGGGVAQVLATRLSRNRVAALVLIDTICYERTFAPNWPMPDMAKAQDPERPHDTSIEEMLNQLRSTLPNAVQNAQRLNDVINDYIDQWNSDLGKQMLYQHIRLLLPNYSNSVASDLKLMAKPTLIIWGENDQQMPLKLAQRLHQDIPESRLVIIPGAGHMILFDAADQLAGAIGDFVGRL